jgi:hypothetical protein
LAEKYSVIPERAACTVRSKKIDLDFTFYITVNVYFCL